MYNQVGPNRNESKPNISIAIFKDFQMPRTPPLYVLLLLMGDKTFILSMVWCKNRILMYEPVVGRFASHGHLRVRWSMN